MPQGLRVFNSSGFTQIDETTVGFQVLATGTLPASDAYSTSTVYLPDSYPDDIIVVVRPHNNYRGLAYEHADKKIFCQFGEYYDSSNQRVRYIRGNVAAPPLVVANDPLDYAIIQRCNEFDPIPIINQNPPNYGLNVFNASGQLTFTTEKPTYRVRAATHNLVSRSSAGTGTLLTNESNDDFDRTYIYGMAFGAYSYYNFGPPVDRQFISSSRIGFFNYSTNSCGVTTQTFGGDDSKGANLVDYIWEGHRTDMAGYIV